MLEMAVAGVMFASLLVYVLTGGADFGGGLWDLFAAGPRKSAQRALIERAMAPIWEVNHIWLILVLVLLFSCFPKAFAVILTGLHVPLTVMLLGIVLRGAAFALRQYSLGGEAERARWGIVFAAGSLLAPMCLGIVAAALVTGKMAHVDGVPVHGFVTPWCSLFGLLCGAMLTALCAHLAAVYLCVEAQADEPLAGDFRLRALASGLVLPITAWGALMAADRDAPAFAERLSQAPGLAIQAATAAVGLGLFVALLRHRFRFARWLAGTLVLCTGLGLALGLWPCIVSPEMTFEKAAAPSATLQATLVLLAVGSVILGPSLYALLRAFKRPAPGPDRS